MSGASIGTLCRRAIYGGRKGRSAERRLKPYAGWVHPRAFAHALLGMWRFLGMAVRA